MPSWPFRASCSGRVLKDLAGHELGLLFQYFLTVSPAFPMKMSSLHGFVGKMTIQEFDDLARQADRTKYSVAGVQPGERYVDLIALNGMFM